MSTAPWQSGLRGARANLVPGLILQGIAVAVAVGYYWVPLVHAALSRLEQMHQTIGLWFSVASTGLCGGIVPFIYLHFAQKDGAGRPRYDWLQGLGLTVFWAYKGIEVDLWYRLQAHMFGSGHDMATIAIKVVMDQLVYCPVFAVPITAAVYQLVDSGYVGRGLLEDIRKPHWYMRKVLPVLISNLGVWVPAVVVIYMLPTALQLPLQNLILCFYTLIVAHQTRYEIPDLKPVQA
jgi:membrane protein insertase Oxa1/YidC/SpoIIIJ